MPVSNLIFWLIADPITFGFGSIGAYIFFQELTVFDHFPTLSEILKLFQKRKFALIGLVIAIVYFFYRLYSVIFEG